MPNSPQKIIVRYMLAPLVQDGCHCLFCLDVEGMERAVLEWVDLYYGGSPWQKIARKSVDIFALVENDILQWPAVERITAARFQVRLKGEERSRRFTLRPGTGSNTRKPDKRFAYPSPAPLIISVSTVVSDIRSMASTLLASLADCLTVDSI